MGLLVAFFSNPLAQIQGEIQKFSGGLFILYQHLAS
jgi:hypothetical protein